MDQKHSRREEKNGGNLSSNHTGSRPHVTPDGGTLLDGDLDKED